MQPVTLEGRVGDDGVLRLEVPFPTGESGRRVRATLQVLPEDMSQEEWRAAVLRSAGSIPDPTFVRHPQGEHQERDPL